MKFNKTVLLSLFASLSLANPVNDNISSDVDSLINEVFNFDNLQKMYVNNVPIDNISKLVHANNDYIFDELSPKYEEQYSEEEIKSLISNKIIEEIDNNVDINSQSFSKRGYCTIGKFFYCHQVNNVNIALCWIPNGFNSKKTDECVKDAGSDRYTCWQDCDNGVLRQQMNYIKNLKDLGIDIIEYAKSLID